MKESLFSSCSLSLSLSLSPCFDLTRTYKRIQLSQLGIASSSLKFNAATLECDEWVAVREQGDMVAMCNLNTGSVKKKKINADGVLMYSGNLIALRLKTGTGSTLQCYEGTNKISSVKVSHQISFWTFLNKSTVGYVSGDSVYHWNIRGNGKPKKIFQKIPSLSGCQIINYVASSDLKWLLLSGIKKGSSGIEGKMMLYSVEKKKPQAISGHTGTFADVTLEGQSQPVTVVAFTEVKPGIKGRLQIMQVGGRQAGVTPFRIKPVNIPYPAEALNDFPIAMQSSPKHDMVYVVILNDVPANPCISPYTLYNFAPSKT